MSGGRFQYNQYRLGEIADQIEEEIRINNSVEKDEWGYKKGHGFSADTIQRFSLAITALRRAETMAQRIDWLLSGDDSEKSFMARWDEEVSRVKDTLH